MKGFLESSQVYILWTPEEDEQLLRDCLTIGPDTKLSANIGKCALRGSSKTVGDCLSRSPS
jgi:hypothetical protein